MGLVQYAPEEEQNELASLLAKAASTKTVHRKVTDGNKLSERGTFTFTNKELSQMSDDTKKLFIYNNNIVRYRYHNGVYQARFRRDGYNIEVASKDFEMMKNKFFAALMEQTVHRPSKKPLMKDYLIQWLSEKKPTLKEVTYKSYESLIKTELIPNFGEKHVDQVNRKEIQEYLFRVVGQGKNRTAQKIKQLLGAVFALAVEDYDFKNPMTKIKLPHYEVKKGSPLSKTEEKQLIDFCMKNSHLYGIHSLLVLLYTGMRLGELASMKIESENNYTFITCETEKIRKGYAAVRRRIPISPMFRKIWDMIDFEKAKVASSKTLSDTIKKVFPERHVHELRYTFISRCKECVQKGNQEKNYRSKVAEYQCLRKSSHFIFSERKLL